MRNSVTSWFDNFACSFTPVVTSFFCLAGGTLALYSLLCRHAKISTIPNQHKTDEDLTTYSRQTYEENSLAAKIKRWLETRAYKRNCLLILVLLGTCTAIGDGILTPAISGILHNFFWTHVQHHIFVSKLNVSRNLICDFVFHSSFCIRWYKSSKSKHEYW